MSDTAVHVIVGRVRKAHGIRGELVVEPYTDAPDAIFASGRRLLVGDAAGRVDPKRGPVEVLDTRPFKEGLIIPGPAEDEIYLHDLPGMRVELQDGALVGTVSAVFELPQGLVLDVARAPGEDGKPSSVMIPYDARTLVAVDREGRRVVVSLPDGLLD